MADDERPGRKIALYNKVALVSFTVCLFLFVMAIWTGIGEFAGTGGILLVVPVIAKLTALSLSGFFEGW
jgi:hypothetical protein